MTPLSILAKRRTFLCQFRSNQSSYKCHCVFLLPSSFQKWQMMPSLHFLKTKWMVTWKQKWRELFKKLKWSRWEMTKRFNGINKLSWQSFYLSLMIISNLKFGMRIKKSVLQMQSSVVSQLNYRMFCKESMMSHSGKIFMELQ